MANTKLFQKALRILCIGASVPTFVFAASFQYRVPLKGLSVLTAPLFTLASPMASSQTFNSATVGSTATPAISFNFGNAGGSPGDLAVPAFAGTNPSDFAAISTCNNVERSQVCAVTVSFTPTAAGNRSATLNLNGTTYAFSGSGIGIATFSLVSSNSSPYQLGSSAVGARSTTTAVLSFKNTGSSTGSLSVPAFTGDNPSDFGASSTCDNVAINGTCAVTVAFTPQAAGARAAKLALEGTTYSFNGTGISVMAGAVSTISTSATPFASFVPAGAYDPSNNSLYAASFGYALVQTNLATGIVTTRSATGTQANSIAVSPSGAIFVNTNGGGISTIDKSTWTPSTWLSLPVGAGAMGWSQYDSKLYVAGYNTAILYKIDTATKTYSTIPLPGVPNLSYGLAISATTGDIYMSINGTGYQVTQGGTATVDSCANAGYPAGFAADAAGNVYFGGYGSHRVFKKSANGTCTVLAGSGASGAVDGVGTNASFSYPATLMSTPDGSKLYVFQDAGRLRLIQ